MISRALPYISLLKLRIVALLVILALVAALVAGAGDLSPGQLVTLAAAELLACAGASVLNNYLDRDIDAVMARTRHRALPAMGVNARAVLFLGLGLTSISLALGWILNFWVFTYLGMGTFVYVVLYTMWLKRRTSWNIVVGGLSGSFAVLAGWSAVKSELSVTPLLIALIVFLWTPSHFWSFAIVHQESYRAARVPMLPGVVGARKAAGFIVLHSLLLMIAVIVLYLFSPLGELYLAGSTSLNGLFLASNLWLWRDPGKERAWRNYKFSGLLLLGIFLFMALDTLT